MKEVFSFAHQELSRIEADADAMLEVRRLLERFFAGSRQASESARSELLSRSPRPTLVFVVGSLFIFVPGGVLSARRGDVVGLLCALAKDVEDGACLLCDRGLDPELNPPPEARDVCLEVIARLYERRECFEGFAATVVSLFDELPLTSRVRCLESAFLLSQSIGASVLGRMCELTDMAFTDGAAQLVAMACRYRGAAPDVSALIAEQVTGSLLANGRSARQQIKTFFGTGVRPYLSPDNLPGVVGFTGRCGEDERAREAIKYMTQNLLQDLLSVAGDEQIALALSEAARVSNSARWCIAPTFCVAADRAPVRELLEAWCRDSDRALHKEVAIQSLLLGGPWKKRTRDGGDGVRRVLAVLEEEIDDYVMSDAEDAAEGIVGSGAIPSGGLRASLAGGARPDFRGD